MASAMPIFREYIGPKAYPGNLTDFPDIINPKTREFHFIFAFAAEKYESGKGTGEFYRDWTVPNIDGEMIWQLKNKSKNVKVVISIGGRGSEFPFDPAEKEFWLGNATKSLIAIINDLKGPGSTNVIDGIDINYDTIKPDKNVFTSYMGRLINSLKNDHHLVISIAPSHSVEAHYRALFVAHKSFIDSVNYQFYTHAIFSRDQFEKLYRELAKDPYTDQKLLAGFSTDPKDAGNLPQEVFIDACKNLLKNRELPGIFVWNANDSARNDIPFQVEQEAQNLLTQN